MTDLHENPLIAGIERTFSVNLWSEFLTIVAVSGGPDSVALLRALHLLGEKHQCLHQLVVAHVNHGVRGESAERDANFVASLASSIGLPFHLLGRQRGERPPMSTSEETLRDFRFSKLIELAGQLGARYLVTGHHAGDQVETILFRLFRGSGLAGLQGIPKSRVVNPALTLVRPMLEVDRNSVTEFLSMINQPFCHDESNDDSRLSRNFIRHELLPRVKNHLPGDVEQSILRLSHQANAAREAVMYIVQRMLEQVSRSGQTIEVDCSNMSSFPQLAVQELFVEIWRRNQWPQQSMDQSRWERLAERAMSTADGSADWPPFQLPGGVMVRKGPSAVMILNRDQPTS